MMFGGIRRKTAYSLTITMLLTTVLILAVNTQRANASPGHYIVTIKSGNYAFFITRLYLTKDGTEIGWNWPGNFEPGQIKTFTYETTDSPPNDMWMHYTFNGQNFEYRINAPGLHLYKWYTFISNGQGLTTPLPGDPEGDAVFMVSRGVGGYVIPVDKIGLLAPYIGLASTTIIAITATIVYVKRFKHKKQKQ